ncbi:hypothetical protein IT402_03185 [Candidatus Nomurabacteria bacterium]|nr:hypothetical protein [Candidatus Nomurabacteria bacterium]
MKKLIYTTLSAFFGLALIASPAFAGAEFNNPGEMPTVTVSSGTCQQGAIDGCWKQSTTANADGTVGVHIFYHNTGNTAAQGTVIRISPQVQGPTTTASFSGSVSAGNAPTVSGNATVSISSSQKLTFVDAKWYPGAYSSGIPVSGVDLFGSGFNAGTVNAGEYGKLVARFKVSNTIVVQNYQCNDGIDNDGDGYIDYPNDPGCSSPTDNDEYNQTVSQCVINSFYASPTNVTSGGYTTLYWNTSNCDSVTVDGISYPVNGSGSFGPLYSGRNYELRAFRNGQVQTRSTYVSVNQVNPTYQCNDGIDNDGDGKVDYPNDPGCSSYYDNDEYNQVVQNTQPQAVTTVATILGTTSTRLNGIAIPNTSYSTTAWFQWGTNSNLSFRTNAQSVNNTNSTYISDTISGLVPNTVYYYRTVVQNQNGTAYGDIVRFQTQKNTTVVTTPTIITKVVTQKDVVVAKSTASLLELRVENVYDRMCIGGEMDYTISYRNISSQTLQNAVLRITHPKELTLINSSRGDYEVVDRTITIALGDIPAGGAGSVQVRAKVNTSAIVGNLAVTTATVVYTNTTTRAQEDAIAYSLVNISNDCPNVNTLGASAFGLFLPSTLLGWLILILVILALIVLGRQLYKKKE